MDFQTRAERVSKNGPGICNFKLAIWAGDMGNENVSILVSFVVIQWSPTGSTRFRERGNSLVSVVGLGEVSSFGFGLGVGVFLGGPLDWRTSKTWAHLLMKSEAENRSPRT